MMFDIKASEHLAAARLHSASGRRRRSDAGRSRLPPVLLTALRELLLALERPPMARIRRRLDEVCRGHGLRPPSRATLYKLLGVIPGHGYRAADLPPHVREALYNLSPDAVLPGHQLVFYCFNYGALPAVSYAAGLPWLDLYQASRLRGWRRRSLGLLRAALRWRSIA